MFKKCENILDSAIAKYFLDRFKFIQESYYKQ